MATNGANTVEDADMAECDGEKVVTMMDVLQEQQDFEDDANAVLGASDEKNCTYSKGYIKRQAIYACLSCCAEAKDDPTQRAGVCLACSLNCHENHELIELYTKRSFRCDCGNPKFNSHPCQFTPDKTELNDDNKYNQNFSGIYCKCHRPYPDPESTVEDDEMIQCIICEDWLHSSHLDAVVPGSDQYSEMVCKACMESNEFLHDYSALAVNFEMGEVVVTTVNGTDTKIPNGDLEIKISVNGTEDSTEDTTEKTANNMDLDETQTENQDLQKPAEENKESESDITMEADKAEDPSQISSEDNSDAKDDSNTPTTSEDQTTEAKATEDSVEGQTSVDKESAEPLKTEEKHSAEPQKTEEKHSTEPQKTEEKESAEPQKTEEKHSAEPQKTEEKHSTEPQKTEVKESAEPQETGEKESTEPQKTEAIPELKETKETEEKIEQDKPVSESIEENSENNTENNEVIGQATEITTEDSNGDEQAKVDSKDSDENNVSQKTNEYDGSLDDKDSDDKNAIQTTENDDTSVDTKPNDIDMNEGKTPETKTSDVAKDEISTDKTDSTETDKTSNETTSEAEPNDSVSKVVPNEIPEVNTNEPCVNNTEVSNATVNGSEEIAEVKDIKRKLSTEEDTNDNLVKKPKLVEESHCTRPKHAKRVHTGATFWPSNFRQKLCTCNECLSMYKDLSVLFLLDPEDTVIAYETLGKEMVDGRATQYEKGLEALSSLGRIQQINAMTEYNKMKDKLLDFLKSFKDRQEVVKEEDIRAFFAGMKPKRGPDGVYFCR